MIKIRQLKFGYSTELVLNNIELNVRKGEVLCLLGANGSGKTTLLKCMLGFEERFEGSINLLDTSIKSYTNKSLAKCLSFVPQKQESSFPYTVMEMVIMGRNCHLDVFSRPKKLDYDIAMDALKHVGMESFADRSYMELSGGESQLVMIARALTQESECIVMDEPTSHLDYRNELVILETIKTLVSEQRKTVIN